MANGWRASLKFPISTPASNEAANPARPQSGVTFRVVRTAVALVEYLVVEPLFLRHGR
jgi:hypothetical protein